MESIIHKKNKEGKVEIKVKGDDYRYVALLSSNTEDDAEHVKESSLDTSGLPDSEILKKMIVKTVQSQNGENGEHPLIVDK